MLTINSILYYQYFGKSSGLREALLEAFHSLNFRKQRKEGKSYVESYKSSYYAYHYLAYNDKRDPPII
jgi:O-phosphoseryl-tRNA(Cys) synthetase